MTNKYKTAREVLTAITIEEGSVLETVVEINEEILEETMRENGECVWDGDYEEHRWATFFTVVSKYEVEGETYYLSFSDYTAGGDNDAEGCGYHFEGIDNVQVMEPYEKMVIDYRVIS